MPRTRRLQVMAGGVESGVGRIDGSLPEARRVPARRHTAVGDVAVAID